jgi:glyoxylase-like metal-dependent hydrolase (beta-lactamase superfamily II)
MEITYTVEEHPAAGAAMEVAPGVRWLRMPLPFALDHINLWLVADGDAWAAVDTGIALDDVKDCWRTVLRSHRLSRQIVTHFHPDHLGLAAWLEQETGAPMAMTLGEYAAAHLIIQQVPPFDAGTMAGFFRRHGLAEHWLEALAKRGNAYRRGVPAVPASYQRLRDGDLIRIGKHDWRVIVGYGHAPEHASLHCEGLGVLIAGDMLLPRISTNVSAFSSSPDCDALGQFLDSIRAFTALPEDTLVLPSHGLPFRGIHARVDQLVEHHAARCEDLLAACAAPRTAAELMPVLFPRELKDAHQVMFAMGEAIAHLVYLEKMQRVIRSEENGVIRFARIH